MLLGLTLLIVLMELCQVYFRTHLPFVHGRIQYNVSIYEVDEFNGYGTLLSLSQMFSSDGKGDVIGISDRDPVSNH